MCQDDLCVLLPAKMHGGEEYVSARDLAKDLGGTCVWDSNERQLCLNLRGHPGHGVGSGDPVDFRLPAITSSAVDGSPRITHLSDFRGKKVEGSGLFWAYW